MTTHVRIATRGSTLALAQAQLVTDALAGEGVAAELVMVETDGDRRAPDTAWGEGAFVKSIERALLEQRADIAVHSAKDVPTDEQPELRICAYLPRQDARDALVLPAGAARATIDSLPAGSVVGTDSPRRTGFLRARRPDLDVRPLHGNVDTRLRRLDDGEVDALVLAVAGLVRLGRDERISERVPAEIIPPAPGQGAIALQVRADDHELIRICARLDDSATRQAVETECEFLRAAGGGCRAPIGALATVSQGSIRLLGGFATVDGRVTAVEDVIGPLSEATSLASGLAARLAAERNRLAGGPRVIVTRPTEDSQKLAARMAEHGIEALIVPAIEIEPLPAGGSLDRALGRLHEFGWAVVTSANGARAIVQAARRLGAELTTTRWAAVGNRTARELRAAGVADIWVSPDSTARQIGVALPVKPGEDVLLARGSLADEDLPRALRDRGAVVTDVVAYRTREAPPESQRLLAEAMAAGPVGAAVFASPSAVRGLIALSAQDQRDMILGLPAICIGPTTAGAARSAGFAIVHETPRRDATALAELAAEIVGQPAPVLSA